jgi:hypothetical protein
MELANTLAYFDTAALTAVKGFIVQAPEVNPVKKFLSKFTYSCCKLDHFRSKE